MKDLATHALNQLLRLSAYTLAKLVVKRSSTLSLLLVGALLVVASGTARAEDWPAPGLDAGHARFSAERSGARFTDGRWLVRGGGRVLASPVVADGFVVTADLDGDIRALRADDGQLVWRAALESTVQGTPAMRIGRVFVPTVGNKVVALRLLDGAQVWTRDVDGMTLSSPTAVNADLVVSAGFPREDGVAAVGRDGRGRLAEPAGDGAVQQHVAGGGRGAGGRRRNGGRYYAFDAATGALRWDYVADGLVHLAAPLIAGGRVYMAGGDDSHRVHAVEAATGVAVAGWPISCRRRRPTSPGPARPASARCRRSLPSRACSCCRRGSTTRWTPTPTASPTVTCRARPSSPSTRPAAPSAGSIRSRVARCPTRTMCRSSSYARRRRATRATEVRRWSPPPRRWRPRSSCWMQVGQGAERAHVDGGAALASPVLANGRLITVAINGSVEGLGSTANHAPLAPILSGYGRPLDVADVTLRWLPAVDPDGELASYELRIDADGELLETWQQQLFVGPGTTTLAITTPLSVGRRTPSRCGRVTVAARCRRGRRPRPSPSPSTPPSPSAARRPPTCAPPSLAPSPAT